MDGFPRGAMSFWLNSAHVRKKTDRRTKGQLNRRKEWPTDGQKQTFKRQVTPDSSIHVKSDVLLNSHGKRDQPTRK